MIEWILVDGYNLIHELYKSDRETILESQRDLLVQQLLNYCGYHSLRAQVVFDGQGIQIDRELKSPFFEIIFTRSNETADQWIEQQAFQLIREGWKVRVVTSDLLEQQQTFGSGAIRVSSREMVIELKSTQEEIGRITELKKKNKARQEIGSRLNPKVALLFEKWRREGREK